MTAMVTIPSLTVVNDLNDELPLQSERARNRSLGKYVASTASDSTSSSEDGNKEGIAPERHYRQNNWRLYCERADPR